MGTEPGVVGRGPDRGQEAWLTLLKGCFGCPPPALQFLENDGKQTRQEAGEWQLVSSNRTALLLKTPPLSACGKKKKKKKKNDPPDNRYLPLQFHLSFLPVIQPY
jgi:hypothetical protein